jgi:hypothetical protein
MSKLLQYGIHSAKELVARQSTGLLLKSEDVVYRAAPRVLGVSQVRQEDDIKTPYDSSRLQRYKKSVSGSVLYRRVHIAEKIFQDNTRENADIIRDCIIQEQSEPAHPEPRNAGKMFVRTTVAGKRTLKPATEDQVKSAPFITVSGKDSGQTSQACSAIAGIAEKHFSAESPEQLWPQVGGNPPLAYMYRSTTTLLEKEASETHSKWEVGRTSTHGEAEHVAQNYLLPRYMRNGKLITNPKEVIPLCGYSYSAGGTQWMIYVQALEDLFVHRGVEREEARNLIGHTIRLAGIGFMPDMKGLSLYNEVNTLYTVSIYDCGTRPQKEEFKRIFGNPEIEERLQRDGVVFVYSGKHRVAVFGELPVTALTMFGHSPKAYQEQIRQNPLLVKLYQAYLKSTPAAEMAELIGKFEEQGVTYDKLVLPQDQERQDNETGLVPWKQRVVGNYIEQLDRESKARAELKNKEASNTR